MVLQKYKLELRWDAVEYNDEDLAVLKGAYFTGPVLKEAAQLRDEDQLTLDMTSQHAIFTPMADYYHAILYWKGVEYKGDRIFLKEAWVRGKYVNSLETLENSNWILIDCAQHEEEKHPFHLVYWAKVMKAEGEEKY
jgi:hypothetical protein